MSTLRKFEENFFFELINYHYEYHVDYCNIFKYGKSTEYVYSHPIEAINMFMYCLCLDEAEYLLDWLKENPINFSINDQDKGDDETQVSLFMKEYVSVINPNFGKERRLEFDLKRDYPELLNKYITDDLEKVVKD